MAEKVEQQPKKKRNWIKVVLIGTALLGAGLVIYKKKDSITKGFKGLTSSNKPEARQRDYSRAGYSTENHSRNREFRNDRNRTGQQPKAVNVLTSINPKN